MVVKIEDLVAFLAVILVCIAVGFGVGYGLNTPDSTVCQSRCYPSGVQECGKIAAICSDGKYKLIGDPELVRRVPR